MITVERDGRSFLVYLEDHFLALGDAEGGVRKSHDLRPVAQLDKETNA